MFRPVDAALIRPLRSESLLRVSREVPALLARPAVLQTAAAALDAACRALSAELSTPFTCEARLMPAPVRGDREALRFGSCFVALMFATTGEQALLELEAGFAAALIDRLAGGTGGAFAPGELTAAESAALGFLLLVGLRAVSEVPSVEKPLAVRLQRVARSVELAADVLSGEPSWLAIELSFNTGAGRGGGRLLLPARTAVRLVELAEPTVAAPAPSVVRCELPALLTLGAASLTEEDARELAPGDVVLLSGIARAEGSLAGPARLAFDSFHLRGAFDGTAFTLATDSGAISTEESMSHPQPPPLPIELEVELARVRIPLSQLGQIQPGAVFSLDVRLNEPVTLRLGGRAVARAELVDIEGEVGARILAVLP